MTVFENISSKNIDELVEWLDKNGAYDYTPWEKWYDRNYCRKCEPVVGEVSYLYGKHECAYCELYNKCRYFQDIDKTPNRKQTIRLWLESEI